jgi:hypothetical protein
MRKTAEQPVYHWDNGVPVGDGQFTAGHESGLDIDQSQYGGIRIDRHHYDSLFRLYGNSV